MHQVGHVLVNEEIDDILRFGFGGWDFVELTVNRNQKSGVSRSSQSKRSQKQEAGSQKSEEIKRIHLKLNS